MLEVTSRRGGIDMGLYRKKPVVVEAVRLTEKNHDQARIFNLMFDIPTFQRP